MNLPVNGQHSITLEDITGINEESNYVIWNYELPLERRIELFKYYMKKRYPNKKFTKKEIDELSNISFMNSKLFIALCREYIKKK